MFVNEVILHSCTNVEINWFVSYISDKQVDKMLPARTLLVLAALVGLGQTTNKLQELFSWRAVDYAYPNEQLRQRDLLTKRFVPENNLPVGIEIWRDKLFVSVPRWMGGIPATLNYVPLSAHQLTRSPPLIPYPDWASNEAGNCERGMTTVYRIKADRCDRLWVLDTGTFGIGNTTTNPCPYALNVFDLRTDRRIRRYELRPEDTNARTFIANIAVDIGLGGCDDTYAYMSDELGYGLIAYSWQENKSWRFEHSYFMPDPLKGDFNIGGLNFQWGEEGIFGMALSPITKSGNRVLFFAPLASDREFAVSTAILRNSSRVEDSYHDFMVLEERAPLSHTTSRVMSEDGVMLFNLIDRNAVGCWNSATSYTPANHGVVDMDDEALIFPADVKIDTNRNVWVISDRMPNFLIDKLDFKDINFRIFFAPLDVLIKGTVCEKTSPVLSYRQLPKTIIIPQQNHILPESTLYNNQQSHRFAHFIRY